MTGSSPWLPFAQLRLRSAKCHKPSSELLLAAQNWPSISQDAMSDGMCRCTVFSVPRTAGKNIPAINNRSFGNLAVAKKHKRKIVIDGQLYFWSVREDFEHIDVGTDKTLTIVSDDKKFLVKYPLDQKGWQNFIVVLGGQFGGGGEFGGCWKRVICPKWETTEAITPKTVRDVIVWSLSHKANVFVDYMGSLESDSCSP